MSSIQRFNEYFAAKAMKSPPVLMEQTSLLANIYRISNENRQMRNIIPPPTLPQRIHQPKYTIHPPPHQSQANIKQPMGCDRYMYMYKSTLLLEHTYKQAFK